MVWYYRSRTAEWRSHFRSTRSKTSVTVQTIGVWVGAECSPWFEGWIVSERLKIPEWGFYCSQEHFFFQPFKEVNSGVNVIISNAYRMSRMLSVCEDDRNHKILCKFELAAELHCVSFDYMWSVLITFILYLSSHPIRACYSLIISNYKPT